MNSGAEVTCAFTGHRPQSLPWGYSEFAPSFLAARERLRRELCLAVGSGYKIFLTGMAVGADQMFASLVIELIDGGEEIELRAAVPCRTQASRWTEPQKARYWDILSRCSEIEVLQDEYSAGCMQRRNRWMVDRSGLLIALWNGSPSGGTAGTLRYAREKGLRLSIVNV